MEVFHDGVWGTVCDDGWTVQDSNVVCRELGYQRSISAPGFGTFGVGRGRVRKLREGEEHTSAFWCLSSPSVLFVLKIWLDDVECSGNEASIFYCPHSGWGVHNCVHGEDASAVCTGQ